MNVDKQTQMKALIARGKEQGYLTVAEVSDHFPEVDSEQMDELIGMLQGLGIVRLTRLTVAGAIKRGELVSLLGDYSAEEPVPIHAVYPHRKHLASKVTTFVEFILEKFTPPPWEV
mgnify:CR=1 FL=1